MSKRGVRIIPRVEDPITQLTRLALDRGWHLKKAVARDPATGENGEMVFLVPDSETWVFLRDDLFAGIHYFSIVGPDQEKIADEIKRDFNPWTASELFAWWDQGVASDDVDARVDAVLFLGVHAPEEPHEEYVLRIQAALGDKDKDVRNAAVAAAAYADWRIFRKQLEQIAAHDPDEKARERARYVVEGWAREDAA
jgi:hypothetical protein